MKFPLKFQSIPIHIFLVTVHLPFWDQQLPHFIAPSATPAADHARCLEIGVPASHYRGDFGSILGGFGMPMGFEWDGCWKILVGFSRDLMWDFN
jgi:hypothetical protein